MNDPTLVLTAASTATLAVGIAAVAALRGWQGWLEVRRLEVDRGTAPSRAARGRGEIARLRERVRRLEAIADGAEPGLSGR